jgi:addiction module RelE/StbE family toxin
MKLVLDDQALKDLRHISDWIARNNPRAADELITRIFDKIERLETPELTDMGRPGTLPGTRELIEYPYIVVYEVTTISVKSLFLRFCTERKTSREFTAARSCRGGLGRIRSYSRRDRALVPSAPRLRHAAAR